MRRYVVLALLLLALMPGCALSDIFFNLFGGGYSAGGHTEETRRMDYDERVSRMSEPPRIPGTSTSPF